MPALLTRAALHVALLRLGLPSSDTARHTAQARCPAVHSRALGNPRSSHKGDPVPTSLPKSGEQRPAPAALPCRCYQSPFRPSALLFPAVSVNMACEQHDSQQQGVGRAKKAEVATSAMTAASYG
eukprot:351039-Chlamydomonas_euryale.AAC.3